MENYNNVVIVSADRNGSTAFQNDIKPMSQNQDYFIFLSECFSQDKSKNQPPEWWDEKSYSPKKVIETINKGTGKSVSLKIQITWANFNNSYFDIAASRKIFLHRNLFDSTLSRCIAQKTGLWHTEINSNPEVKNIYIGSDFFKSRLEYRIERYLDAIPNIYNWANEFYRYESYRFTKPIHIKPNPDKKSYINDYNDLYDLYRSCSEISYIENEIKKIEKKCLN